MYYYIKTLTAVYIGYYIGHTDDNIKIKHSSTRALVLIDLYIYIVLYIIYILHGLNEL